MWNKIINSQNGIVLVPTNLHHFPLKAKVNQKNMFYEFPTSYNVEMLDCLEKLCYEKFQIKSQ